MAGYVTIGTDGYTLFYGKHGNDDSYVSSLCIEDIGESIEIDSVTPTDKPKESEDDVGGGSGTAGTCCPTPTPAPLPIISAAITPASGVYPAGEMTVGVKILNKTSIIFI